MSKNSGGWVTWTGEWEKTRYKIESHTFRAARFWSKGICVDCGLMFMNNPLTAWAVRKGCLFEYHDEFREKVRQLT
jgi:hypothetical protein